MFILPRTKAFVLSNLGLCGLFCLFSFPTNAQVDISANEVKPQGEVASEPSPAESKKEPDAIINQVKPSADSEKKENAPKAPLAKKAKKKKKSAEAVTPNLSEAVKIEGENFSLELPLWEKIAADLGYKQNEFKKYVDDFASSLSAGPKSAPYHRLCARDEESCSLIKDFHNQEWTAKSERKKRRSKVNRFRITESNVAQAQRFDFKVLISSLKMDDEYKFFSLAEHSLKEEQCPRNLSAALSVKAEEFFPNEKARLLAKQLFEHAKHCMNENEQSFERLFLRQGLYAYYDGDKQKAREYLVSAKKAKNNTERYRVLYWLGQLANESGVRASDNQDWKELMNEYSRRSASAGGAPVRSTRGDSPTGNPRARGRTSR